MPKRSVQKLEFHRGDDYACIMRAGDTTDAAFVTFKYPTDQDCAILQQMAAGPALLHALQRIIHANDSGDTLAEEVDAFAEGREALKTAGVA